MLTWFGIGWKQALQMHPVSNLNLLTVLHLHYIVDFLFISLKARGGVSTENV